MGKYIKDNQVAHFLRGNKRRPENVKFRKTISELDEIIENRLKSMKNEKF